MGRQGEAVMITTPKVVCPVHAAELMNGATTRINDHVRPHLDCPVVSCTALSGKICDRCTDVVVQTQRRPDLDRKTATKGGDYAAWICPRCEYNNWQIEAKNS